MPNNQSTNNLQTLSIVIAAYNEENSIYTLLGRVAAAALPPGIAKEIIVINDGSSDKTGQFIQNYIKAQPEVPIQYAEHQRNQGKGAALHTGIALASGDFIIIQDADLEYDPAEYTLLLQPLLDGRADVVYGSRFIGGGPHRVLFFWHYMGNRFLTLLSNAFTDLNLTDMESCYKVFKREIIQSLTLREKRFGFEPEVTAKIAGIPGIRIYEVGISYSGRTYAEGKKINWKDGFRALYCILRYNLWG